MGVFYNIYGKSESSVGRRDLVAIVVGLGLIALLSAAPGFAEPGEPHPERAVSTSPLDLENGDLAKADSPSTTTHDDPPLTRAATQLRIDQMSPTRWLSRFGNVTIGRRE